MYRASTDSTVAESVRATFETKTVVVFERSANGNSTIFSCGDEHAIQKIAATIGSMGIKMSFFIQKTGLLVPGHYFVNFPTGV